MDAGAVVRVDVVTWREVMSETLIALDETIAKYEGIIERLRTDDDLYHNDDGHLRWQNTGEELYIGTRGCSLCKLFYKETEEYYECTGCPLAEIDEGCLQEASLWSLFYGFPGIGTAQGFLDVLKLARERHENNRNKKL